MSHVLISMVPEHENRIRHDSKCSNGRQQGYSFCGSNGFLVATLQKDITKHLDITRSWEDPHEALLSGRQPYFSSMALDSTPLSPRQTTQDDRRGSLQANLPRPVFKPPVASHFSLPPRRYGSIGTPGNPPPSFRTLQHSTPNPPATSPQHPLASVSSSDGPNLARRHTAADIRAPPSWNAPNLSPFASGQSSTHWPSSPHQAPTAVDQHLRDTLASYELGAPRQSLNVNSSGANHSIHNVNSGNHVTPPLTSDTTPSTLSVESIWSLGGPKFASRHLDSAPGTRRSSMASNVHSLLNPAETAERDEDEATGDERKRKRVS